MFNGYEREKLLSATTQGKIKILSGNLDRLLKSKPHRIEGLREAIVRALYKPVMRDTLPRPRETVIRDRNFGQQVFQLVSAVNEGQTVIWPRLWEPEPDEGPVMEVKLRINGVDRYYYFKVNYVNATDGELNDLAKFVASSNGHVVQVKYRQKEEVEYRESSLDSSKENNHANTRHSPEATTDTE